MTAHMPVFATREARPVQVATYPQMHVCSSRYFTRYGKPDAWHRVFIKNSAADEGAHYVVRTPTLELLKRGVAADELGLEPAETDEEI